MDGDWQTYYAPAARVIVLDYGHWNKELGINIAGIYGRTHPSTAVSPLLLSLALIAHFSPSPPPFPAVCRPPVSSRISPAFAKRCSFN